VTLRMCRGAVMEHGQQSRNFKWQVAFLSRPPPPKVRFP